MLPVASGRRSAARLFQQAWRHRRLSVAAVALTVVASVSAVLAPLLLGRLVDVVIGGGSFADMFGLLGGLVGVALASGVLLGAARRACDQLGVTLAADLREDVLGRALELDPETLEAAGSGDVASRVTEDVEKLTSSVDIAAGLFVALVTVVVTGAGFVSLDWRLGLAFLAVFPVHWLALRFFLPTAAQRYAAERLTAAERTQTVLSVLNGVDTVRAYGIAEQQLGVVRRASQRAVDAAMTATRAFVKFANMMNIAEAVGLSSVLLTGFFLVRGGEVTTGEVTAAALLFHRLFGPLGVLFFSFNDIQQAGAALARLVGVINLPQPVRRPPRPRPDRAGLHARRVSYHYRSGPPVLRGIDLDVPAGTSLALVGESGAGKTTLAAVLGGVFPAATGDIHLGVEPISELDAVQVRQRVGMVSQEVHVFAGTLAEDLRLARAEAGAPELWGALRTVGADGWVSALPLGLDTPVGPTGVALSADHAQQLALARIVLLDPPIVILDEATAEAGSAGARALERSARAVVSGRTALVVAHRLTQARECDQIAVLAGGRIIECGSHDDLVSADGAYARLWSAWRHS